MLEGTTNNELQFGPFDLEDVLRLSIKNTLVQNYD